jgi:Fuc2NAc and GlcNAc transferase
VTAVLVTLVLSAILCGIYRRFARAREILDTPNERSSHTQATPHGGGVALLTAFSLGLLFAALLDGAWGRAFVILSICAVALSTLGVIDDIRGLSVRSRLLAYGIVCLCGAAAMLHGIDSQHGIPAIVLLLIAAFALLWSLNLYNFMDGIDGIAALQTIFACSAAAYLAWLAGHDHSYVRYCLILAAAHGGFLLWNFPPARLFMGDAGSVPTGFLLAALAILGAAQGQLNPLCWVVLCAVFITDATCTLAWRIVTGQDFTQPHRLHAYQCLSRHWNSHVRVDMLLLAINTVWLFPIALAVQAWPEHQLFLVFLAYLPLLFGVAKVGRVT